MWYVHTLLSDLRWAADGDSGKEALPALPCDLRDLLRGRSDVSRDGGRWTEIASRDTMISLRSYQSFETDPLDSCRKG